MNKELGRLRRPPMTLLESRLKECLNLRDDIMERVLTGGEMAEYMTWMIENFGEENSAESVTELETLMISGADVAKIGQSILADPRDKAALGRLTKVFENPKEESFFQKSRDITAGAFLRFLPPYWRMDEYFEVYYVFSGNTPVYFADETVLLGAGDVLLIPPGTAKACTLPREDCSTLFFMIRQSTFSQVFWTHLSEQNLMSSFFRNALTGNNGIPFLRFSTAGDAWIEELLCRIYQEHEKNGKYSSRLQNSLMSSFFLSLLQGYEKTIQVPLHSGIHWRPAFAEILRYVQEHYDTVTLAELTERFGYSERQIIRIIQESTGHRFAALQNRLRMENAARFLAQGATAVQAAEIVGFSNISSFYRAFSKYFGCTTKQYTARKENSDKTKEEQGSGS